MRSKERPMAEDDDGRRWELTVRGLKRRLQCLGGVAAALVAGVDRRQGGWGGSVLLEKGREWGRERKKGAAMGGARFKRHTEVGNGSVGWRHALGVEEGTRRGNGPEAGRCGRSGAGACPLGQGRARADRWALLQSRAAWAATMRALATVSGFEFFKPVNFI
jgi:hypothetical protein